jgi:hypothetical protein
MGPRHARTIQSCNNPAQIALSCIIQAGPTSRRPSRRNHCCSQNRRDPGPLSVGQNLANRFAHKIHTSMNFRRTMGSTRLNLNPTDPRKFTISRTLHGQQATTMISLDQQAQASAPRICAFGDKIPRCCHGIKSRVCRNCRFETLITPYNSLPRHRP